MDQFRGQHECCSNWMLVMCMFENVERGHSASALRRDFLLGWLGTEMICEHFRVWGLVCM
jgi:hypothetical protein